MKKPGIIVALAAVGLLLYVDRYPTARPPTACETFTAGVAIDFVRPDWCGRVPIEAEAGSGGFGAKGFDVYSWRSECFLAIAIKTNNPKLCSEVKPIGGSLATGSLGDGSGYNEAFCIESVRKLHGHWGQLGLHMSNYELAPIMQQLGYTDQVLLDAKLDPQYEYSWDDYINGLLLNRPGMPRFEQPQQEKLDFLKRVDNLKCKSKWSPF
jgi:hypothetical protein